MKRVISIVLVAVIAFTMFALTGCGQKKEEAHIGLALYSQSTEYMAMLANSAEAKAKELGIKIDIADAKNDAAVQLQQVETMINNGINVLLIASVDPDACIPCVDACTEAGIPVVAVNVANNSPDIKGFVIYEPVSQGEMEMQYLIDYMGRDDFNIVILEGVLGHTAQLCRSEGIENVLAKHPNITVLAHDTGNWMRSEGMTLMENWLINYGDQIDAVVSQNDEMAIGAINAIKAGGYDIPVVSIDGIADALEAIEEGSMIATFQQDPDKEAKTAIEIAMMVFNGETVTEANTNMPSVLIDKNNVADFK